VSKMASDSEGLRRARPTAAALKCLGRKWLPIRKGYDSPLPTTVSTCALVCRKWLPIRKGYDAAQSTGPANDIVASRKWLPIRKGYDKLTLSLWNFNIWCRKWLPIRKGYDEQSNTICDNLALKFVENGFRFGRVTTHSPTYRQPSPVENGFRFGRVTTGPSSRDPRV